MGGMYTMIFGTNPASDWLLSLLGLTRSDMGRFRDAWVQRNPMGGGLEIVVYTRNGGSNRPQHMPDFSNHPRYLRDYDDTYDSTYASIIFQAPEDAVMTFAENPGAAITIEEMVVDINTDERWKQSIEDLKTKPIGEIKAKMGSIIDALDKIANMSPNSTIALVDEEGSGAVSLHNLPKTIDPRDDS